MAIADVRVLGAGIFGLSIAYACLRRGAIVEVVDPNGVALGSSGGLVGALAPHTPDGWNPKKQMQFDSLRLAEHWWTDIAKIARTDPGYARRGRLQVIADASRGELARSRTAAAAENWDGFATWQVRSAGDFAGWCPDSPTGEVIFDTLTARIHPRRACLAMSEAIMALGGTIAATEDGEAKRIVESTGVAGLAELSAALNTTVGNGVKGQAALLRYDAGDRPQLFLDGIHVVPHSDGTVAVGSTSERDFVAPDTTDDQLEDLVARARRLCPALADAPVIDRWAGVRPRARSRAPMVGPHPLRPDRIIANGGFKIGFGIAPKVAEIVADLVLDGRDGIPPEFRPEASLA